MDGLELSLQILVHLHGFAHLLVDHELVRDSKGHEEASGISFALEVTHSCEHPEENVMEGFLVSMDHLSTEVGVEICRVAQNLKEATNTLLRLVLGLLLHVNTCMSLVEVLEDSVYELEQFKWRLVVKLHHGEVLHEGGSVESINDLLDLTGVQVGCLAEQLLLLTSKFV